MDGRETWAGVRALDGNIDIRLGPNTANRYLLDPKRLGFYSARYAVAAKILKDCDSIMDVGCGDGTFLLTYLNDTKAACIFGVDFDEELITYACNELLPAVRKHRPDDAPRLWTFLHADFLAGEPFHDWAGISCLDCLEHILPEDAPRFVERIHKALKPNGIAVIGTPSANAAHLGSEHSLAGHVHNLTPDGLHDLLTPLFPNVLMLGLNDTVAHFGHSALWHYSLAIAVKGS